jgi:hypothetical protein
MSEHVHALASPVQHDDDDTAIIEPHVATGSLLDSLRARRDKQAAEQSIELLVPGYSGLLALRCGPLTGVVQSRLVERMQRSKSPDRDSALNADFLINACTDVVARETTEDEWQSVGDFDDAGPVRVDERLVSLLKLDPGAKNARATLRSLFSFAPSPDTAISLAANEYGQWAAAANEEVDEDFAGES